MADEAQEELAGEGGGDGGGVLKKYGPLAFIVLIAQVVLAWAVVQFGFQGQASSEAEEERIDTEYELQTDKEEEVDVLPYYYSPLELQKIAINPAGTNADRIAQFSVTLGLSARNLEEDDPAEQNITDKLAERADITDKITLYMSGVKAVLREVMSSKTVDELEEDYLPLVQDEIKDRLNQEIFQKILIH